jgi:hypothetical protein
MMAGGAKDKAIAARASRRWLSVLPVEGGRRRCSLVSPRSQWQRE